MSLYVTTQSYRNDIPTEYGYLLEVDENSGAINKKKKIITPTTSSESNERIKPGLRGIFCYKNEIYLTSWNEIFILDRFSLDVKNTISHKWMSDLHGIFVNKHGIWVTSSLPDAVILYDFNGSPVSSLWLPETFLYNKKTCVDKSIDWRNKGKNFRGFKEYHANHVTVNENNVYITGRGQGGNGGRIIKINEEKFIKNNEEIEEKDIQMFSDNLHGPHDGIWSGNGVWVTETLGSTVAHIASTGKIRKRKKILSSEKEKIEYGSIKTFVKCKVKESILKKPGIKMTHWTRGLDSTSQYLYVGQSTKAGDTQSRARIVKVDRSKMKIVDCFYLDIEDYPETRIFQILSINNK